MKWKRKSYTELLIELETLKVKFECFQTIHQVTVSSLEVANKNLDGYRKFMEAQVKKAESELKVASSRTNDVEKEVK